MVRSNNDDKSQTKMKPMKTLRIYLGLLIGLFCINATLLRGAESAPAEDMNAGATLLPKPAARPADWIVEHDPVNPNATPEAKALLKYLYSISGKHTLIGQHNFIGVQERSTASAAQRLGKTPALYGTDWGFSKDGDIDTIYARDMAVKELIKQHRNGSIIAICWHEVRPTADEPVTFRGSATSIQGHLTNAEWEQLLTPGSDINKKWCAQVDVIAGYLKQLQDARVPVLWRPVHEMNGGWFWWGGRVGERGTRQVYRMMYDRLVNYHKLNNLIWVWNCDRPNGTYAQFVDYFPGQQFVDVLALDCYAAVDQSFYDEMNALSDGKVMAISEGNVPALETYKTQPKWTYYMSWAGVRNPVTDSKTTPGAASTNAPVGRRGGGGGGRGGVNLAEMAKDPRMFSLENETYWDSIRPLRAVCGLPLEMVKPPAIPVPSIPPPSAP
jgi:mannan endo-1,4-beta-mannosidase